MSHHTNPKILVLCDVHKSYGEEEVLHGVSLSLGYGERIALMGPSGCGKTTLLNCVGGLDRSDRGSITFDGSHLDKLPDHELALIRRQKIATIFQFFYLLPTLTAFENVEFSLQINGVAWPQRERIVNDLLRRVGMAKRSQALPNQLSGGEMQRVAIARALANRPALILADEPTGNLDSRNGDVVLDMLEQLTEQFETALILVTHNIEATRICHRILEMVDGKLAGELDVAGQQTGHGD